MWGGSFFDRSFILKTHHVLGRILTRRHQTTPPAKLCQVKQRNSWRKNPSDSSGISFDQSRSVARTTSTSTMSYTPIGANRCRPVYFLHRGERTIYPSCERSASPSFAASLDPGLPVGVPCPVKSTLTRRSHSSVSPLSLAPRVPSLLGRPSSGGERRLCTRTGTPPLKRIIGMTRVKNPS